MNKTTSSSPNEDQTLFSGLAAVLKRQVKLQGERLALIQRLKVEVRKWVKE
ncbi:Uncharacterised protein [uncultured archaeon]|nr:Uncharacterised protein [uncultured archaeon]